MGSFFIGCMPSGINFLHRYEEGEQEREWRQGIAGHSVRNTQFFKWKTEEGCRSGCHGIDLQKGCRYLAHSRVALPLRRKMLLIHELAESHKQSWPNQRMGISTHPHSPKNFNSIIYYPKTGLSRFFPEIFHYLCTSKKQRKKWQWKMKRKASAPVAVLMTYSPATTGHSSVCIAVKHRVNSAN